jgi:hypothetical protein
VALCFLSRHKLSSGAPKLGTGVDYLSTLPYTDLASLSLSSPGRISISADSARWFYGFMAVVKTLLSFYTVRY